MLEFKKREDNVVDAIEGGKIVRVSEEYARREGLLVLRKSSNPLNQQNSEKKEEETRKNKGFIGMEDLRKPLNSKNNELLNELVENFHWILVQKRKDRGLTRKKVADSIAESEINVRMIENGVLPANNFILINKLESYYGVSVRKNKVQSANGKSLRQVIDFKTPAGNNVVIHPIKRSDGSALQESSGIRARTPKWAQRTDNKTDEIEVLDDNISSSSNKPSDSSIDKDIIEL